MTPRLLFPVRLSSDDDYDDDDNDDDAAFKYPLRARDNFNWRGGMDKKGEKEKKKQLL